jgi:hypothetical protein
MGLADAAGWLGALILVAAYAASAGRPPRRPVVVHLGNLVGSLGLGAVAAAHRALPSVVVNAVWLVIAARALARALDRSAGPRSPRSRPAASSLGVRSSTLACAATEGASRED